MKILRLIIFTLAVFGTFTSCQKELKFDLGDASTGVLKKDASGNCLPMTANGIFKMDSALNSSHFVDVQVNVTNPGTFNIKSDTVNGYSFSKTGTVVMGLNTIRLYGSGKPIAAGTNTFTITYGTSTCSFNVTVINGGTGTAIFTLGGTPGTCTGASTSGPFTAGVALTAANTLTIQVNVTTPGTYIINAASTSGFSFSGAGVFTIAGLQNVTLNGSGMPSVAGNAAITITNIASTCSFSVTVLPGSGGGGGGGGTGSSQYYFSFTEGTNNIAADTSGVVALSINNSGLILLSVGAFSVTGDSSFSIGVTTTGSPVTGVTYKTSNIGVPIALFNVTSITNGVVYQADVSTMAQNINIKFDVIDTVNKIVSGTFSGTAKGLSGNTVTITNGKFRAELQ
jgi:hypothetical protein